VWQSFIRRESQDGSIGTAGSLREVGWLERPDDGEEGGVVGDDKDGVNHGRR
jgi:hypothetical protein